MQAGPLRHLVTIEEPITVTDSDGDDAHEWVDPFGVEQRAEITPLSGRELIAAQAVQSKVTTRIVLRYRPGVTAAMRVVHRSTVYNIEAVVPDNQSGFQWITLMCTSGVNDG
jgi:SPP1 family predicted phage head-tail adaptor